MLLRLLHCGGALFVLPLRCLHPDQPLPLLPLRRFNRLEAPLRHAFGCRRRVEHLSPQELELGDERLHHARPLGGLDCLILLELAAALLLERLPLPCEGLPLGHDLHALPLHKPHLGADSSPGGPLTHPLFEPKIVHGVHRRVDAQPEHHVLLNRGHPLNPPLLLHNFPKRFVLQLGPPRALLDGCELRFRGLGACLELLKHLVVILLHRTEFHRQPPLEGSGGRSTLGGYGIVELDGVVCLEALGHFNLYLRPECSALGTLNEAVPFLLFLTLPFGILHHRHALHSPPLSLLLVLHPHPVQLLAEAGGLRRIHRELRLP
mmetsp:Transcript_28030/g.89447  ORF Transcript_28030/g.89447 Transcript_28030/m.89447 type:complete len:320 (-) Transcript_28030:811-1770(-)